MNASRGIYSLALSAIFCGPLATAHAQLGPQLYSLSHAFAATATLRGYGMGGAVATISGPTSLNPAHMAATDAYEFNLRSGRTEFVSGTRFDSTFASIAVPLGKKDGLQILYTNVRTPTQPSFTSALFPGSTQRFREESLGIFYGHRITDKLSLGIAGAPLLKEHHHLDNLGAPGVGIDFDANPVLDRSNHLGGRFGADYKFASWGHASVIYDNFWERATMTVSPALAPAGIKTRRAEFHEATLISGVEVHPVRNVSLVIERESATLSGHAFSATARNTRLGAEWEVRPGVAVRIGSRNGEPTYGAGYTRGRFNLQVARVNNLAGKQLAPVFGPGNHLTVIGLGYKF